MIVDPEVTRLKFERELELWRENGATYRRRGWILLGSGEQRSSTATKGRATSLSTVPHMSAATRRKTMAKKPTKN